jgi:hypothetical protein
MAARWALRSGWRGAFEEVTSLLGHQPTPKVPERRPACQDLFSAWVAFWPVVWRAPLIGTPAPESYS